LRAKVEAEFNRWDKRNKTNRISVESDIDAIHACKRLGLLPMPRLAQELLYSAVDAKDFSME
ncbi:MAG: hypothetical protein ACKO66_07425, partial [Flavobacteriales bacterium]